MGKASRKIAVDLFCGVGGMSLGFEMAGFDILAAVDIDPIHCLTHHYNFPFWTVLCASITEITAQEIRSKSSIQDGDIDVVFGGPPCQGFSLIGKRQLEDTRNTLLSHFLRLVLELQPKYFVMENVKGIALGESEKILAETIDNFTRNGYQVQENYQILNAAHYQVPQNRERLFLLGSRQGYSLPRYPLPFTHPQGQHNLGQTPTVFAALQDLPEVNDYPELLSQDYIFTDYQEPSDYASKLRGLTRFERDYSYPRILHSRLLTSSKATEHSATSIARFAETPPGTVEKISRFYRLAADKLCHTLRAGTPSNRGAFTAPRPIHYATPRCITVREAARLHSYPDWFRFHVTKWHGFRQVGNSVPPLLAKAVAEEIMQALAGQPQALEQIYSLGNPQLLSYDNLAAAKYFGVHPKVVGARTRTAKT